MVRQRPEGDGVEGTFAAISTDEPAEALRLYFLISAYALLDGGFDVILVLAEPDQFG